MIPQRFVVEYPERCLTLLNWVEQRARKEHLLGSLALLVASAAFVIPFERMKGTHPMRKGEDDDLVKALRTLDKRGLFLTAPFWAGAEPGIWRFSRIVNNPNDTSHWKDERGHHPMDDHADNSIGERKPGEVLRVIRNALAHGNVVYLNSDGREEPESDLHYLGFLSRYEQTEKDKARAETYRLLATTQTSFLAFVRAWAIWISKFQASSDLVEGRLAWNRPRAWWPCRHRH